MRVPPWSRCKSENDGIDPVLFAARHALFLIAGSATKQHYDQTLPDYLPDEVMGVSVTSSQFI